MTDQHPLDAALLHYATGEISPGDRQEIFFHLFGCRDCLDRTVALLKGTQKMLRVEETWDASTNVEQAVTRILKGPPATWWEMLYSSASLRVPSTVRALLAEADRIFSDRPTRNLQICAVAARLADQLVIETPVSVTSLRFDAWKDLSTAHRVLGDIDEAMRAIETAASLAPGCDEPEHCLAQCDFARAIILTTAERYSEASIANIRARAVFEQTDFRRFAQTFWQEAIILAKCGRLDDAARTFESLIGEVVARGNRRDLSDLYGNIAGVFAELGRPWMACDYLARSIEIDRTTGSRVSELRNTWTMGVVLRSTGRIDESIETLERAVAGYRELEMGIEIVRVELDIALARIERGDVNLSAQMNALAVKTAGLHLPVSAATVVHELKAIAARRSVAADLIEYSVAYLNDATSADFQMPFQPPPTALPS